MQPQVSPKNLSLDNLPSRRVLSVAERESLQKAVLTYGYADAPKGYGRGVGPDALAPADVPWINVNRPRLNAQQKQVRRILEEGTPEPLSSEDRDRYQKVADQMEEIGVNKKWFQTYDEIRVRKRDRDDFHTALDKAREWAKPQKELGGRTPEEFFQIYRNIKRCLEPDNEEAGSLDRLRERISKRS